MRDLSALDPRRHAPEATVVRLPEWRRRDDGAHEAFDEVTGAWRPLHVVMATALESLRDGDPFERTYERACAATDEIKANHVRILLRRYFWQLHRRGHVRIAFDEPPESFAGRYRRVKELGRGGVGVAHLCVDERTGREVVVKHAWGYLSPIDRTDRAIRKEAAVMRALDHPGIVSLLDEFERDGLAHLVRDYADGAPLTEAYAKGGSLARDERPAFARAAADALLHVHERGYLFLDYTPGNVVLRADRSPLVLDVGICAAHDGGRLALGGAVGSRGYAAPEIMEAREATVRSDVYSFGCFYQYLATGANPRHRCTREERAQALREASVDDAESAFILACCEDAPEARPRDVAKVVARLTRLGASA